VLLLVAGATVLCLVVAIAIRPFWGLAALCLLIPFQLHLVVVHPGIRFTAAFLIAFATLLILTVRGSIAGRRFLQHSPLLYPVLAFVLVVPISFLNSEDVVVSYRQFKDLIRFVAVFLAFAVGVRSTIELRRLWTLQLLAGAVVGGLGIVQLALGPGWTRQLMAGDLGLLLNGDWIRQFIDPAGIYKGPPWTAAPGMTRVIGTFFSGNYYASYLGYLIPFGLAFSLHSEKPTHKIAFMALVVLYLVNLAGTFSRGGWLALSAVLALLAWVVGRRMLGYGLGALTAVGLFLFAYSPFLVAFVHRMASMPAQIAQNPRWDIWAVFIARIMESPLIGHGILAAQYVPARRDMAAPSLHAHSLYLMVLYAWGFLGFMALVWLLWRAVGLAWHQYHHSTEATERILSLGLLGSLVWFLVHNAVDFQFFQSKNGMMFWFALASLHCIYCKRRDTIAEEGVVSRQSFRPSGSAMLVVGAAVAAALAVTQLQSEAPFEGLYVILIVLVLGTLLSGVHGTPQARKSVRGAPRGE